MPHVPKPSKPNSEDVAPAETPPLELPATDSSPSEVVRQHNFPVGSESPNPAVGERSEHGSSSSDVFFDSATEFEGESRDELKIETHDHQLSLVELSEANLMSGILAVPGADEGEDMYRVEIVDAQGQDSMLMRIDHAVKLRVQGSLGDYAFAFNSKSVVKVFGNVGHGVAEGMVSGSVRVRGHAGHGAGTAMSGGTLGIYGSAGDRVGAAMRGGGLFVRGNVGNDVGLGALGGTIVIGGDAGENLGDPLSDVAVFLRGKAASLADGVTEAPLRKKQEVKLGLLLISAGIRGDAKDFRRIVPTAKLDAENASRGEVVPNWR